MYVKTCILCFHSNFKSTTIYQSLRHCLETYLNEFWYRYIDSHFNDIVNGTPASHMSRQIHGKQFVLVFSNSIFGLSIVYDTINERFKVEHMSCFQCGKHIVVLLILINSLQNESNSSSSLIE